MAMRHSSGCNTLISISFFMRSLFQFSFAISPTFPALSRWESGRWGKWRQFIGEFEPGAFEHGAGFEQVLKPQEAQHFFGAGRPGRSQVKNHFQNCGFLFQSAIKMNPQISEE